MKTYCCLITILALVVTSGNPWGEKVAAEELSQFRMQAPVLNRSARISSKVRELMNATDHPEGSIRVIVRFRPEISGDPGNHEPSPPKARKIRSLKRNRQIRHDGLSSFLGRVKTGHGGALQKNSSRKNSERRGSTANMNSFWIANSVAVTLTPSEIEELAGHPEVLEIMENKVLSVPPVEVNSLSAACSGGGLWNLSAIGLDALNDPDLTGNGIRIGHLDTGIEPTHPDFEGKLVAWAEFDSQGRKINSEPHETHDRGHGTHTASVMVAKNTGVAPGAVLLSAMVLPGGSGTLEQVLAGMEWLLDPDDNPETDDGARIINMSWGTSAISPVLMEAIENLTAAGVLPVCAIGNEGSHLTFSPGNFPDSVGVGAVDPDKEVPYFSGGGMVWWGDSYIIKPDITAPGTEIPGLGPFGEYQTLSGTSLAAPHVAGAAALLLQKNPFLSLSQLKGFLFNPSLDLGGAGQDLEYGRGILDVPSSLHFMDRYGSRLGSVDLVVRQTHTIFDYPFDIYEVYFSNGSSRFLKEEMTHIYSFSGYGASISRTLGVADVNGDGQADLVISQSAKLDSGEYLVKYLVHPAVDASGLSPAAQTWYSFISPTPDPYEFIGLTDVNGDRNSDLLLFSRERTYLGEKLLVVALISNGRNAFAGPAGPWTTINTDQYHTVELGHGDVNGDGKADLVFGKSFNNLYNSYPVDYHVSLSSGNAFGIARPWITVYSTQVNDRPQYLSVSDVNGDGLDDLLLAGYGPYGNPNSRTVYVCLSDGLSRFFSKKTWAMMAWNEATSLGPVKDVNRDGLSDLLVTALDAASNRWAVAVWLSNGQDRFIAGEAPWLVLDQPFSPVSPEITGLANVGLGDWSGR